MTIDEALRQAAAHHQDQRYAEAEALYRRILAVVPDHGGANHNLGRIAMTFGQVGAALPHLRAAVAAQGDVAMFHLSLGEALASLGHRAEAGDSFARARTLAPGLAAEQFHQGNALFRAGRFGDATLAYDRALALDPTHADALNNLGSAFSALARWDEAIACHTRALELRPDLANAHYNLGVALARCGRLTEAERQYRRAAELEPDSAETHNNLGGVLSDLYRFEEAAACHRRALELKPDMAGAHYNLGSAMKDLARFDDAISCFGRVLEIDPGFAEAHNNLAAIMKIEGRYDEALGHYRKVLELDPGNVMAHRNLLAAILYHPGWTPEMMFAEHRRFEAMHARPHYPEAVAFANSRDPGRRLRIGYLSSDLKRHPVGRNLIPLIEAHDRAGFELFFYAHVATPDEFSRRFQAQAAGWRSIYGADDDGAAEVIRADRIDILVSLAGRFDLNRPQICARRPAPVMVSFHDPATSGMEVMDAIIADRVLVPRHGEERFTERPIRLPSFYLHDPIDDAPPPASPPLLKNGFVTFGSFNNPSKLSEGTLALWAEVLHAVPESRLRLKYREWIATPPLTRRITGIMADHGIGPERLQLLGSGDDTAAHLALYHDIDIALDPFPFNGSTTTFEALWMGVPVVTLPQAVMVGRWTASILAALKLDELIAASPEHYVDICAALAADPDRLGRLRAGLRPRLAGSALCNPRLRARQVERAYRALWRQWCDRHDR